MNNKLKKCLISGASLLMLASVGTGINNVNVNARHVRSHRVYKHHNKKRSRQNRRSVYSLEKKLANIRYNQVSKQVHNRSKFVKNYIKGLTNYLHYSGNYKVSATVCGATDANYYASVLATKRYAHKHHMSKRWLNNNLKRPVYGYLFNEGGTGNNNFISGVEYVPVMLSHKMNYRRVLKIEKEAGGNHQYIKGLKYSHSVKPKYYRLRKPSYHELQFLIKSRYVKNVESNTSISNG